MKNYFIKKIIAGTLIISIVFSLVGFTAPKKAEAQWVTFDPSNFGQSLLNVVNTTATAFSTYSLEFKAFVLDTLATTLAKQLIRQITADVVNWINSGFEGSPAFLSNPGGFLVDVADQVSGAFLAQAGGPLTSLCSPFSIDIRLALSFKYHPNVPKRYECTIGKIIANSKNAIKGATINGFAAGDFRQGGWPAFVSMTTEPQNNVYGAFLEADSELSIRVANAQIGKKEEVNNGKGFLSWRNPKCAAAVKEHNDGVNQTWTDNFNKTNTDITPTTPNSGDANGNDVTPGSDYGVSTPTGGSGGDTAPPTLLQASDCPIETPGSLIVSNLETSVNGPLHELELVDSINEIVNALVAQLVTTVLKQGLASVSGSGASDSTSYLSQIRAEADVSQLASLRNDFLKGIETYVSNTLQYKTNKDQSLRLILDAKSSYDGVNACYAGKIRASTPPLTPAQVSQAQSKITETDAVVNTTINPVASELLVKATEADNRYKKLTVLKDQANAAKTVNDLNAPTATFSKMLASRDLTTAKDISDSQTELENTKTQVATIQQDAQRRLQQCQLFPYNYNN